MKKTQASPFNFDFVDDYLRRLNAPASQLLNTSNISNENNDVRSNKSFISSNNIDNIHQANRSHAIRKMLNPSSEKLVKFTTTSQTPVNIERITDKINNLMQMNDEIKEVSSGKFSETHSVLNRSNIHSERSRIIQTEHESPSKQQEIPRDVFKDVGRRTPIKIAKKMDFNLPHIIDEKEETETTLITLDSFIYERDLKDYLDLSLLKELEYQPQLETYDKIELLEGYLTRKLNESNLKNREINSGLTPYSTKTLRGNNQIIIITIEEVKKILTALNRILLKRKKKKEHEKSEMPKFCQLMDLEIRETKKAEKPLKKPVEELKEMAIEKRPTEKPIENPIIEKPVEKPIEKSIVENPILEKPILEKPIIEKPIIEKPIIEKPIIERPIMEKEEKEFEKREKIYSDEERSQRGSEIGKFIENEEDEEKKENDDDDKKIKDEGDKSEENENNKIEENENDKILKDFVNQKEEENKCGEHDDQNEGKKDLSEEEKTDNIEIPKENKEESQKNEEKEKVEKEPEENKEEIKVAENISNEEKIHENENQEKEEISLKGEKDEKGDFEEKVPNNDENNENNGNEEKAFKEEEEKYKDNFENAKRENNKDEDLNQKDDIEVKCIPEVNDNKEREFQDEEFEKGINNFDKCEEIDKGEKADHKEEIEKEAALEQKFVVQDQKEAEDQKMEYGSKERGREGDEPGEEKRIASEEKNKIEEEEKNENEEQKKSEENKEVEETDEIATKEKEVKLESNEKLLGGNEENESKEEKIDSNNKEELAEEESPQDKNINIDGENEENTEAILLKEEHQENKEIDENQKVDQKEEDDKSMNNEINEIEEVNEKSLLENKSSNIAESENLHSNQNDGKNIEIVKNSQEEVKLQNEKLPPTEEYEDKNRKSPADQPILEKKSGNSLIFSENKDNIQNIEDEKKECQLELEEKSCEEGNKKETAGNFQSNELSESQIKKEDPEKPMREKENSETHSEKNKDNQFALELEAKEMRNMSINPELELQNETAKFIGENSIGNGEREENQANENPFQEQQILDKNELESNSQGDKKNVENIMEESHKSKKSEKLEELQKEQSFNEKIMDESRKSNKSVKAEENGSNKNLNEKKMDESRKSNKYVNLEEVGSNQNLNEKKMDESRKSNKSVDQNLNDKNMIMEETRKSDKSVKEFQEEQKSEPFLQEKNLKEKNFAEENIEEIRTFPKSIKSDEKRNEITETFQNAENLKMNNEQLNNDQENIVNEFIDSENPQVEEIPNEEILLRQSLPKVNEIVPEISSIKEEKPKKSDDYDEEELKLHDVKQQENAKVSMENLKNSHETISKEIENRKSVEKSIENFKKNSAKSSAENIQGSIKSRENSKKSSIIPFENREKHLNEKSSPENNENIQKMDESSKKSFAMKSSQTKRISEKLQSGENLLDRKSIGRQNKRKSSLLKSKPKEYIEKNQAENKGKIDSETKLTGTQEKDALPCKSPPIDEGTDGQKSVENNQKSLEKEKSFENVEEIKRNSLEHLENNQIIDPPIKASQENQERSSINENPNRTGLNPEKIQPSAGSLSKVTSDSSNLNPNHKAFLRAQTNTYLEELYQLSIENAKQKLDFFKSPKIEKKEPNNNTILRQFSGTKANSRYNIKETEEFEEIEKTPKMVPKLKTREFVMEDHQEKEESIQALPQFPGLEGEDNLENDPFLLGSMEEKADSHKNSSVKKSQMSSKESQNSNSRRNLDDSMKKIVNSINDMKTENPEEKKESFIRRPMNYLKRKVQSQEIKEKSAEVSKTESNNVYQSQSGFKKTYNRPIIKPWATEKKPVTGQNNENLIEANLKVENKEGKAVTMPPLVTQEKVQQFFVKKHRDFIRKASDNLPLIQNFQDPQEKSQRPQKKSHGNLSFSYRPILNASKQILNKTSESLEPSPKQMSSPSENASILPEIIQNTNNIRAKTLHVSSKNSDKTEKISHIPKVLNSKPAEAKAHENPLSQKNKEKFKSYLEKPEANLFLAVAKNYIKKTTVVLKTKQDLEKKSELLDKLLKKSEKKKIKRAKSSKKPEIQVDEGPNRKVIELYSRQRSPISAILRKNEKFTKGEKAFLYSKSYLQEQKF